MTKRKMPAVLLAGLMILALAGCNANKATPDSGTAADSRITETVTDSATETTVETALPADTENKTEATAEKEKAESSAPAESGTAAETRKPAESADKAETVPPTQAPKQTEPPKINEPQPSRRRADLPKRLRQQRLRLKQSRKPNLLQRSRRRASPRPTIHASCPRSKPMRKAIPPKASPSNGQRNWNSDGMWAGWERRGSAVTVWTGSSAP